MRAAGLVLAATLAVPAVAQSPLGRPAAVPAGPTAITPAERSTLQRAQQLLRSGDRSDAEQAHTLLAPLETQRSDEVDFSYLLGLAALGSGKTSEAIFALQRAVAGEPGFAGARLELARAYYEAGDNEDARREFERVAAQNPPPPARRLIEQYLEAIDRRALRYRAGWQASAEFGGGFDSNANGGTGDSSFLGIALNEASRETDSAYFGAQGQLGYSAPLTPALAWRTAAEARHREYPDADFVTLTSGRLRTGLTFAGLDWQLNSDVSAEWLALDGQDNRRVLAADLSAQTPSFGNVRALASLRAAQIRYDESLDVQDVDQWLGALLLQWQPSKSQTWQLQAGPVIGSEKERRSGSPYGRELLGARVEASGLVRSWIWRASLGGLESDYDGLFFGQVRTDRQFAIQLQLEVPDLFDGWSLRPSLALIDNQSDIPLYEYERLEAGLTLQRRW